MLASFISHTFVFVRGQLEVPAEISDDIDFESCARLAELSTRCESVENLSVASTAREFVQANAGRWPWRITAWTLRFRTLKS